MLRECDLHPGQEGHDGLYCVFEEKKGAYRLDKKT